MPTDFEAFRHVIDLSKQDVCRELFYQNTDRIRIQKAHIAAKNLARIIDSTLHLANTKGFQAMSLRDLCRDSGISMGGLYSYIRNKNDLVHLVQSHGFIITRRTLVDFTRDIADPRARLFAAIRTHIYLSEIMRPWFYFSYMEVKRLPKAEKRDAIAIELETETLFYDILREGIDTGVFRRVDARALASLTKAMLQDWYLKRGKYRKQQIGATEYAELVRDLLESYL